MKKLIEDSDCNLYNINQQTEEQTTKMFEAQTDVALQSCIGIFEEQFKVLKSAAVKE